MKTFMYIIVFTILYSTIAQCQVEPGRNQQNFSISQVTMRVLDKETFKPVNAKIFIVSQKQENTVVPIFEDKIYKFKIPVTDTTTFSIYAKGYETLTESILASEINGIEAFYLTPKTNDTTELDGKLNINNVSEMSHPILRDDITSVLYFKQSSTNLSPRSKQELERVLDFTSRNEILRIELAGHTDNLGDAERNMELSVDRASVVRQYLMANNISPARIRNKAYGSTRPAAPNDSERNRRFNRRVVIRMAADN
ncbi:OmpA family protein [Dyadobacter sp. NIV53]|uniref:OmpA family protein n=1 Tax=Dyadobacter sp. NIV53 TaxID=2861765 RepID=UPI001C86A8A6|nr:OmpA family protein [Dyadobacter sp. NIV53]